MKKFYQICGSIATLAALLFVVGKANNNFSKTGIVDTKASQTTKTNSYKAVVTKTKKGKVKKTYTVPKFSQIKLACYRPDVVIDLGKKFKITVIGEKGADVNKINTKVDNNQLTVYDEPEYKFNDGDYQINITVPHKNSVKEITGFNYEYCVIIDKLNIPSINLSSTAGSLFISDVKANNVTFTVKNYDAKQNHDDDNECIDVFDSKLKNSNFNVNKGNIYIYSSKLKTNTFINHGNFNFGSSKAIGQSTIDLNTGNFSMFDMFDLPKINCDLTTDSTQKIKVGKKYYSHHFSTSSQANPLLKVTSKTGKISISKD